jgi:hypothetical protein
MQMTSRYTIGTTSTRACCHYSYVTSVSRSRERCHSNGRVDVQALRDNVILTDSFGMTTRAKEQKRNEAQ